MRIVIFLLVLVNLLFFVWSRYLGSDDFNTLQADQSLRADQIHFVSNDRPPEIMLPVVSPEQILSGEPNNMNVCTALSDLSRVDADAIERLFVEKLPTFKLSRTDTPGHSNYWVHIPPFKTRREAENKVAELRNLGIRDYFIQPEGNNSFAISLGLFSTRLSADSALEALKEKGVRLARIAERPRRLALSRIEFSGPEAQTGEMRQLINQLLPLAVLGVCVQSANP